ncbi:MAG: ATP-dependent RecD-like DNA helicase [Lachnospiraceae bacterium]|nr:ATP-dependent RecD-like DNA helicase [Lachnospiraceae bacterium]
MTNLEGYVEHIIYRNTENAYTVLDLSVGDGGEITLVGIFSYIDEGDYIEAEGEFIRHPSYGEQFKVSSYTVKMPEGKEAMFRYLASGGVDGIREATAKKIIKKFGDDTFRIMTEEPERLAEIKGISLKKAISIHDSFVEKAGARQAMMFLQKYGISNAMAMKVYEKYRDNVYRIIEENPYKISDDIAGIGFKKADEIAEKAGIERHSEFRIKAGITYALRLATGEGNVYLPQSVLETKASDLLSVGADEVSSELNDLAVNREIIMRKDGEEYNVYLPQFYNMEIECAKMLDSLDLKTDVSLEKAEDDIKRVELRAGLELDEDQRRAVVSAIENGVFILTGGPGTGKTTTLRVLIKYFIVHGENVMLAAPTGRAARRMSEATGMAARTIHRMLGVDGGGDSSDNDAARRFARNEEDPLETDVVVVDEMSMVDIRLFTALLRAITPGTRLIMVGDEHQLPSVGPGMVLRDLIKSGKFSVATLEKVFRQAELSDIVMNAHAILHGREPKLDNKSKDFFFLGRDDPETIIQGIIYLVSKKLPPYVKAEAADIQVMTPMKKGMLGVEVLNQRLQEALNPKESWKAEKPFGNGVLRTGDKVMQIKNNYQIEWEMVKEDSVLKEKGTGVFNGDMGIVESIDPGFGNVTVLFDDGRRVVYPGTDLSELELAYAITIHKSQGSEYPAVVMPIFSGPEILMNRNLLYTGITRAKSCVVVIGRREIVDNMIRNTQEQKRYTSLSERIIEVFER